MNKKGQALVLFIIFLPVFLIALALIVDVGLMYKGKIKATAVLEMAKEDNLDIADYFEKNDLEIEKIEEKENCEIVTIKTESVFGRIIGYNYYEIKIDNC